MLYSDQAQREEALDPTRSFIVQAPAGSGKTELLTQRFLRLLTQAKLPEEILAVTFTRKAAAQMRQRILVALESVSVPPVKKDLHTISSGLARQIVERDKALGWDLLNNPNRLKIMTIDAICAYIVNKMPILSHFGVLPEIADYPQKYYQQAVDALLMQTTFTAPWGNALKTLLLHLDNRWDILSHLFSLMLAKRDLWLPYIGRIKHQKIALETYLSGCLCTIIREHLAGLSRYFDRNLQLELIDLFSLDAFPLCDETALESWRNLATLLTTENNQWRKSFTEKQGILSPSKAREKVEKENRKRKKEALQQVMERLAALPVLVCLTEVKTLPSPVLSSQQQSVLHALHELLPVLVAFLQVVFQEAGKVDFTEVALRALEALGEELSPSEIALRLDYQIQHILIDEYQDTSVTQYRLFEKLVMGWQPNDGRTLFLVGDPMQSIYRFRGAEVSLFLYTKENGLAGLPLTFLSLSSNFRSAYNVIDWINKKFAHVFPDKEKETQGGIPYSTAIAVKEKNKEQAVFLYLNNKKKASQAVAITELVQTLHKEDPKKHIGILVRAKKHLNAIIQIFKQEKIQFIAHEVEHLVERPHVIDLLSLLKATTDLSDSIAWYAVLRAPWLGLSLEDLLVLSQHSPSQRLWLGVENYEAIPSLSQSTKKRLKRFVCLMRYWFTTQFRLNFASWLRGLWIALGGPYCYSGSFMDDIEYVLAFIESMHTHLVPDVDALKKKLSECYGDILPQGDNARQAYVELMTIHKSKGLEFDVVLIPYIDKTRIRREPSLLLWHEYSHKGGLDLIFAACHSAQQISDPLYEYVARQIDQKSEYELRRLLYVGATRAQSQLYFFADYEWDEKQACVKKPVNGSFFSMLWPFVQQEWRFIAETEATENKVKQPNLCALQRLPEGVVFPELVKTKLDTLQEEVISQQTNLPESSDYVRRCAGIVFHRILQHHVLQDKTLENEDLDQLKKVTTLLLKRMGLVGKLLCDTTSLVIAAVRSMREDPFGQWLLSPLHSDRRAEWQLSTIRKHTIENDVIDYAFVDTQNRRWIVDYKLTQLDISQPSLMQKQLQTYRPQLLRYKQLLRTYETRTVFAGLYFPLFKKWVTV